MKLALPRIFRRAVNALPDVNEHPASGQAAFGVVVSLLVHLGILVLWLGAESGWVGNLLVPKMAPPPEMDIVIQTVTPPPSFAQRLSMPLEKLMGPERVDSAGLQEAAEAPKMAVFSSDKNLAAGSQERPTGSAPVPTVSGRREGSRGVFADQEMRAGTVREGRSGRSKAALSSKKNAQKKEAAQALPTMEELAELTGELVFRKVSAEALGASKASRASQPRAAQGELGEGRRDQEMAERMEKVEDKKAEESFGEGKVAGEAQGGLAENGKVGVNAAKSPMGVFMKSVSRAIGVPWNQLVNSRMESIERGMVEVRIWVTAEGRVERVDVERSSANAEFVELCLEAVRAARLDPPPLEAQPLMREGLLPIPFKFNFL
jgi:TonB family protein